MEVANTTPGFGLLLDFRQKAPAAQGYGGYYAECLAQVQEAEALGFQSVWLSEHHCTLDGFLPSPLVAAAAIAARTSRIGIGTGVLALPLHHPLRVAEDAAVVDLLSGGRFLLGVGQGYARREFEAFGVDRRQRPELLEDGIAIIRTAWEQGRSGFQGASRRLPDLPFGPRPERRVPIYVGAVSRPAVERAVRLADGLIVYCGRAGDFAERWRLLRQVLAGRGEQGRRLPFVATGILHLHEDAGRAWREAAPAIAYLEGALARDAGRDGTTAAERPRRGDFLVGAPDEVAEALARLHREVPFDQFAFWGRLPGLTHEQALRSMRLFSSEVAPRVRARARR